MASDDKTRRSRLQRRNPLSPAVLTEPDAALSSRRSRPADANGAGANDKRDDNKHAVASAGAADGAAADSPAPSPADKRGAERLRRESNRRQAADAPVVATRYQNFSDFYADHADPIYRALTVTLGDPVLAADATSEAMTRACQRWASVRDGSNPPGWVYRVGLNWSRSRWRKLRRERPLEHQVEHASDDLDPTATLVQGAVSKLPMPQRSIVVLRYYLQWTPTEIADSLDLAVGTVKSRLHRGLAAMREDLAELELDGFIVDDAEDEATQDAYNVSPDHLVSDSTAPNGKPDVEGPDGLDADDDGEPTAAPALSPKTNGDGSDEIDLVRSESDRDEVEVDLRSRQRSIGRTPERKDRR